MEGSTLHSEEGREHRELELAVTVATAHPRLLSVCLAIPTPIPTTHRLTEQEPRTSMDTPALSHYKPPMLPFCHHRPVLPHLTSLIRSCPEVCIPRPCLSYLFLWKGTMRPSSQGSVG